MNESSPIKDALYAEIAKIGQDKISELLPFDLTKLKDLSDENLIIQKEILTAFLKFTNPEKKEATAFLEKIG